ILSTLALLNLEQFSKPGTSGVQAEIKEGRLYFDRIEGKIEIEKGKILLQNLTLQGPVINIAGAGTIDLNRDHLQLRIGFQPLGIVDSLVGGIPLIGNILTGKEKAIIVYNVEVTGSMSNPQIKTIPLKNPGESALGYVERMVFTPERILKSLTSLNDPRPPALDYHAEFDQIIPAL
ncbi:MAG: AsmA-like C-terminal domain-containing protein, partial [Deltaproteobacteria bacterium]